MCARSGPSLSIPIPSGGQITLTEALASGAVPLSSVTCAVLLTVDPHAAAVVLLEITCTLKLAPGARSPTLHVNVLLVIEQPVFGGSTVHVRPLSVGSGSLMTTL